MTVFNEFKMHRYILPALVWLIVLTGCSKKYTRTYDKGAKDDGRTVSVRPGPDSDISPKKEARPGIVFPVSETQHVRITSSYDPFVGSSSFDVDLGELAGEFCYPYYGEHLSPYGYRGASMHTGVDIRASRNDTIRSVLPGVVRMSKEYSGYGNVVVVRHYNGLESLYAHNNKNLVKPNDIVEAGAPLALAGRTGRASTEHLHFELRVMGEHLNPALMIDPERQCLCGGVITVTRKGGSITASNPAVGAEHVTLPQQMPLAVPHEVKPENKPEEDRTFVKASSRVHSVSKGDTLYSISRRYGTTVASLCALNGISENSVLSIGQKLKIE